MAYAIGDACVACGACEAQCPVGAISMGDGKFEIDPDKCIDCGSYRRYLSGLIHQRKYEKHSVRKGPNAFLLSMLCFLRYFSFFTETVSFLFSPVFPSGGNAALTFRLLCGNVLPLSSSAPLLFLLLPGTDNPALLKCSL